MQIQYYIGEQSLQIGLITEKCKYELTNERPDARNGQFIVGQTIQRSGTVSHSV